MIEEKKVLKKRYETITVLGLFVVFLVAMALIQDYKYIVDNIDWTTFEIISFNVVVFFIGFFALYSALYLYNDAKKNNEKDKNKIAHDNFLKSEKILHLEKEIYNLKHKELILYMIAEMLHNKEDREGTYTNNEVGTMLSKARVFTPYYGAEHADINHMKQFIEYLSNDAWVKIFKKPASETDFKVKEWFDKNLSKDNK